MAKLIGRVIGGILNVVLLPVALIFAIPAGFMKARRHAGVRLLFTGEEQSLLAKAQRAISMDNNGLFSPDDDLLEMSHFIERSRIHYQIIKGRERYDATFLEFLRSRLGEVRVDNWPKIHDFFGLSLKGSSLKAGAADSNVAWKNSLCNWLNGALTVGPEDMTAEDMFRVVKGTFDPATIDTVERLVLGDAQGGRGISELPESLYELRGLRSLHLQRNDIEYLSDKLGQLSNLEELKLGGNPLKALPASIGQLKKLRILTLWWNDELKSLPPEIGQLSELEGFDVSACENLKGLPREIVKLRKIQRLYLPAHEEFNLTAEQQNWVEDLRSCGAKVERYW